MSNIKIFASSNSTQTGVVITDETNWTLISSSRSALSSLVISLYGSSPYQLSNLELSTFINTGSVEISFLNLNGNLYLQDGWYLVSASGNTGAFISNDSGFGIYATITGAVFSNVNGLHIPEEIKYNAEKIIILALFLKGLNFLDTTSVNSRDVKFSKRLLSLQKMLLKI